MADTDDTVARLMVEAKRQNPPPLIDRILALCGYRDGWFVLKGEVVRRRPFRWLWQCRAAYLLFHRWNAPADHPDHYSRSNCWAYARGLAELLHETGDGYLSPSEAIHIDREYWEG